MIGRKHLADEDVPARPREVERVEPTRRRSGLIDPTDRLIGAAGVARACTATSAVQALPGGDAR